MTMEWGRLSAATLALSLLGAPAAAKPDAAKLQADFARALECKAYTQMLPSLGDPAAGERIHRYWIATSDQLGKEIGLSPAAIELKGLVDEITVGKAEVILPRCIRETPKKALRSR